MMTLIAALLFSLPALEEEDRLPARMTLEDPPEVRQARRRRQQEEQKERPGSLDAARPRGPEEPGSWAARVAPTFRLIGGKTRVREFDFKPIWLDNSGDLGLDVGTGVRISVDYETSRIRWFLELDLTRSQGSGQMDRDFHYDEDYFLGGVPYKTHADLFFARTGLALPGGLWQSRNARLSPFVGLEYVRLSVGIDQPAAGKGTSEQYEQFVPYPIFGVLAEVRLAPDWTLSGRLYGGIMPNVATWFEEGGRMYMEAKTVAVDVELSWIATDSIRLFAGIGYHYWYGRLYSVEDDNEIRLSAPLFTAGVEIHW
jgi:hypothetical protein